MKTGIAIVIATALLVGVFGFTSSTENDLISPIATTVISMIGGAILGAIIAMIAWLVQKVIK